MLVINRMDRLVVLLMGLLLGCMMMVVGCLRLKFGDLHAAISLVGMSTIHQRMLRLMGLVVHCQRVEGRCLVERRGAGGRWNVVAEL